MYHKTLIRRLLTFLARQLLLPNIMGRHIKLESFQRYRDRLRSERNNTLGELPSGSDSLAIPPAVAIEDLAAGAHDQFVAMRRQTIAHEKRRDIDSALARLDAGEYGICQECDKPISEKRLSAIPWASRCVPCQEKEAARAAQEGAGGRSQPRTEAGRFLAQEVAIGANFDGNGRAIDSVTI